MKTISYLKSVVAISLLLCLTIFILQNREVLELRFLSWTFETRRAYMLIVIFTSGLATGWIVATLSQLTARGRERNERDPSVKRPGARSG